MALVGLGGIGKTQVALQFAYSVKANKQEYSIFWVAALSEASFEKAYAEMAHKLGVKKSKEDEDVKDLVHHHLCSEEAGKWLLIVDNADDVEVVMGSNGKHGINRYLPKSESGRVVFTTRSREVAVAVAGSDIIDLREMTKEEATAFVETSLTRKELLQDEATTVELLRELTYLPLAIAQAVAYLNQNQISVRKYLVLLRGTEQSKVSLLSRGFHDRTRYEGLQNAVATTWLVSFAQIQRSDKAAASILGFVSCIEPKAIPRSILPEVGPEEEMEHAIGTLRGYAFLSQRDEEMFDMHSLVHVATWVWLESEGLIEQTTRDAIRHIEKEFPRRDRTRREKWRGYVPHGLRVLNRSSWCQMAERYDLFMTVGFCLYLDRRFKEAIICFEAASEWRREHFTEDDDSRLSSEHALASAYLEDRQIKEAIEIFEHVVAVKKRTLADEDHSRLSSEHVLASAYLDDRRIKEAIEIFEHVVVVRKRTLGEEDHSRLSSEHELARAYMDDRQIKKAIEIFEHVVAVQKRTLADEDQSRLVSEHELARVYLNDGRIKEAIEIFERVVAVTKRTMADEDYFRLTSEHTLASAYLNDRRIKEAIEIFEHVVVVDKRILADEDHSRLWSEHELARAYLDDKRIKEAIEILEHVVAVRKRTLADKDHSRLTSEHELARAYLEDKRIKEAIEIFEHVVVIRKRTLAEEDHFRLKSEYELARAYLKDRQIKKAIEIFEHVVVVRKRMLADEDHSRLVSEYSLARAYLDDEMVEEAIQLLEHVVAVEEGLY